MVGSCMHLWGEWTDATKYQEKKEGRWDWGGERDTSERIDTRTNKSLLIELFLYNVSN